MIPALDFYHHAGVIAETCRSETHTNYQINAEINIILLYSVQIRKSTRISPCSSVTLVMLLDRVPSTCLHSEVLGFTVINCKELCAVPTVCLKNTGSPLSCVL